MALGLYDTLQSIKKQLKNICCKLKLIQDSGAGSYKVYTALLTQSGGNGESDKNGLDDIFKGVTYYINVNDNNGDFTQYGAPNNNVGTYFVCNQDGVVPEGAQLYYNEGAPVVTVLENTIGNVWWTYEDLGVYSANALNAFTNNKTVVNISSTVKFTGDGGNPCSWVTADSTDSKILIQTQAANFDDILYNTPIEIRVYN